jgi:hypothetical protein
MLKTQGVKRMKTIHEAAKTAGVSVRTLHYYDESGCCARTW